MKNKTKGKIMKWAAVTLCVAAPLGATMSQFPMWINRSAESTMSGLFLLLAAVCCIPFRRAIKEYFKSPSVWGLWIIWTVVAVALRNIIDEMLAVGIVGVLSNVPGAFLYAWGKNVESKEDREGDG